jgi:NADP-dependent 3-hydroxy acid dehydrogenase YdfG
MPMAPTDLDDQVALVTGASRGLGRHTALRLAEAGMRVALCARDEAGLQAVADEIAEAGGAARVCPLDVRDYAAIERTVDDILGAFGAIDVLVNNAGLSPYKPFAEWSLEEVEAVLDVNLKGTVYLTKAVLPHMLERQAGQILNVASDVGRRVIPNMAPYVAAKHGVVAFSGSLLREVKDQGIRVMTLLPGIIDTYFGGNAEGTRDETWALRPGVVAETIHRMLIQPRHVVLDEVTIHPMGQDL